MHRIFDMQPGDVIHISRDGVSPHDIFTEANTCGKWLTISNTLTSNEYKVEYPVTLKAAHIKDQFIQSGFKPTLVPEGINQPYLLRITRQDSRVGGVRISAGVMSPLPPDSDSRVLRVLMSLKNSETKVKSIPTKDISNLRSFRSMVYILANKLGIKVKTNLTLDSLTLTLLGDKPEGTSTTNFSASVTQWLKHIRYDEWTDIPVEFMSKGEAYLKTVISKSGLDCKYKKGQVIKLKVAIRRKDKCLDLRVDGQVIKTFSTMRVCHLRRHDRALINLLIKPYGKTFEDLL